MSRKDFRTLLVTATVLFGAGASVAAQPAATPAAADLCAGTPDMIDPALMPLLERYLTPGAKFDLADLSPATMAKIGELQRDMVKNRTRDWPDLCHYRRENAAVLASGVRPDVVFLGDSITEFWKLAQPDFFGEKRLDRGISAQTTSQMLLRVYPDVVALRPRVVHILAGTNDVAANTGPVPDDVIIDNIRAMIDIAEANGIKVVLASITPVDSKDRPGARVVALNVRLRALAIKRGAIWLDYYPAMAGAAGAIQPSLANDGLHPNRTGYALMRPLVERAIAQALR